MMKSHISLPVWLGLTGAFLCFVMPLELPGESLVNAYPRKLLVGSWSGLAENRISFIRLELNNDGTGRIASTHFTVEGKVFVTPILSWQLKEGKITCQLGKSEDGPETLSIKWNGARACIYVVLKGPDWSEEARLCSDTHLRASEARINRALGQERVK